ncbi:M23 family metallopeptidase [Xanthomonas campestris pv. campestris]|uniref:M23 family metallopeptidase n=1 Tax=Xanthomonas campestris TaxID=339 RepID=UPI00236843C9|nr:M23 family metallopeptidase [Xanthomonas campestris]MDO0847482.1 M23 family metallopeptidase [Xanthomonas campestris pv. campestris]MEA0618904.1 M23 family metallopeptidase [Xanthomonas campestris pv. campestris]MEA0643708.1 M23 family metallopeptidase [Xanthomonas campestris pv. campestris]MEA0688776.1 M23 family metallopeptidase [Xanthomonas campestris pv. campestris]MEB1412675.1 M23 family metallopeptidase [Xanthomonas campestris pv. campestris]
MALKKVVIKSRETRAQRLARQFQGFAADRPMVVLGAVLGLGMLIGVGASTATGMVTNSALQAKVAQQQTELAQAQRASQAQVNALAARLGELQAQATRLNALGERLTQMGKLKDGEFDFDEPVGVGGGDEPVNDMPVQSLKQDLGQLEQQFSASGQQLNVLASLMFDHQLEQNSVPSRMPIRNTYITSGFGGRADPFDGGSAFHKGVDFHANVGDPVMSVADGVVSYAGVRGGYGNVVEVDHGNGYVTRYAHNSRLVVRVGDLVRAGQQVAKAGSSGRSTGAHVHFEVWADGRVVNPRKFLGDTNTPVGRRGRG